MKATLICISIVLCVSMLQDVRGGKTVSEKKLNKWSAKNEDVNKEDINIRNLNLKKNKALNKHRNKLQDLLEVIQYVITDAINNKEFRTFMIKRFLHNYVPQASKYLDTIKELKRKMDPKAAEEDDNKDEAMKNQ
ncbi:uncharacterized protein LOC100302326 precursor [Acyrthosiphon pisum]|uniref:ACYPI43360 protein n=1 Tax=Acyrthosiphon pisum TaxID=7029 RepID=C4WX78_ACYPI|nr:uncharacterized protein LOC100302326 precursor [Acyrthosiphon pisum]BAH72498.1 ACYPI43360 [Acyrthosiphon pisum]BAH72503.1 ACYPI43360 [Acyrthosiphon pisum]BAH72814.1 ACYPI43360 [Acyrthosiphon pisum]|eukprot:NP_001155940.1 uncharacterized protein LOC100302326 precursor [Acyrthosiphon pisum]